MIPPGSADRMSDLRSALATCEQMQGGGVEMLMIFDRQTPGRPAFPTSN